MHGSTVSKASIGKMLTAQHPSPLGSLWSTWTTQGLFQLSWQTPPHDRSRQETLHSCHQASVLDRLLHDYFQGRKVSWHELVLDPTGWTSFTQRVYRHCLDIPYGSTITYKQLAAMAGNERASRAVGAAMSRNRILLVIPCHRVVSASGNLQGYSAKGDISTKRLLLELERQGHWSQDLFAKG